MLGHCNCNAAGRAACALVSLGATVAELCALFAVAFLLCSWALNREDETPRCVQHSVLAACNEGLRDVLARLLCVSFLLFFWVLHRFSADDGDNGVGLEEQAGNENRGQASASPRERRVRRPARSPTARETTSGQGRRMAPGTASRPRPATLRRLGRLVPQTRPFLPVLPATGAVDNPQQSGRGRSDVLPNRAPTTSRAAQGPDASLGRSAASSRSTGPQWMRNAVLVSLSRNSASGPPSAGRASNDPTGRRWRSAPAERPRIVVSSGARFYENVVLRQIRERALEENDDPSDDGGDS